MTHTEPTHLLHRIQKAVLVALLVSVSFSPNAQGQQTFVDSRLQPIILKSVDLLTDAAYEEALAEIEGIEELAPDDPSSDFLKGMLYWHRLVIAGEDNEELEDLFFEHMDRTITKAKRIEQQNKDDVLAMFWLGAGYGYKARYHSANAQWWSAYRNGKRTTRYFERVVALAPDDYDPYLGLGIYHYYAEVVPKIIRIFDFILNMGGDKELGLNELEQAIDRGFFTGNEAKFFLVDVFTTYEDRPWDALPMLLDLTQRFPHNAGFAERLAELYGQLGFHSAAAEAWRGLQEMWADQPRRQQRALIASAEQMLEAGRFTEARSILSGVPEGGELEDAELRRRADQAETLADDLLADPAQASIETLRRHAEILGKNDPPAERAQSLEEDLRARLPSCSKSERESYAAALTSIGRYCLCHNDAPRAKGIFDELIVSDLHRTEELETLIYRWRAAADYRMDLHDECLADLARVRERSGDHIREEVDRETAFVRTRSGRTVPVSAAGDSTALDQGAYRCRFSYPDRGQLAMSVVGAFDDWNPVAGEMTLSSGAWQREFLLPPGNHRYYFLENGWRRVIDPAAPTVERETGILYYSVRYIGP